jgi:hypothetical protein
MPEFITVPQGNPSAGFQAWASFIPFFAPLFSQPQPNATANGAAFQ